jgi:hypothetical protein
MSELQYTTVDRVLAKIHRDLKGIELNESDAIEWIGEALEFLKVPQIQEQAVAFMEVNNYEANLPNGFQMVLQLARHNNWTPETKEDCAIPTEVIEEVTEESCNECDDCFSEPLDCTGKPLFDDYCPKYIPYFDMQWQYIPWTSSSYCKQNFTPIRLANHTFFNSIVCKEKDQTPYQNHGEDEYTIVGTTEKKLRVSFKQGYIALAYIRNVVDRETGYPLVPDNVSYMSAIIYYLKWKTAQMYEWNGREGYARLAQDSERLWLKYARQAKNYMKMPKTLDQFQNLLEQTHQLIPRHRRYYGYFGNLGREENRRFNDPDNRNRIGHYYYGR